MAKTNQAYIKSFKAGASKQRTAELNFLQAVQNWYAELEIGQPYQLLNRPCIRTARYSNQWPQYEQLLYWYTHGFNRGVVTVTFDWFRQFAKGSGVNTRFPPERKERRRMWCLLPEKGVSAYRGTHEPKSEEWREQQHQKKEWRKKKDKRCQDRRGPNAFEKRTRAKCHRSFCRQNIQRENWEAFYQMESSHWEYVKFIDPWDTWA